MSETGQPFELLQRMQQRAVESGHTLPEPAEVEERWQGLAFSAGGLALTAELTAFTDVVECGALTAVPRTRDWLRGVTNVRGSLFSVVDLSRMLGFARVNLDTEGKLLVVNDRELGCALLVNTIHGLRRFDHDNEYREAAAVDRAVQPFVRHAYLQDGEPWGVLDMDKLKSSAVFRSVESEYQQEC